MGEPAGNAQSANGNFWALGSAMGYAAANIFDRVAVVHSDPLVGPLLRGLPSLLLGIVLVRKKHTFGQFCPSSPQYVGRGAIVSFVAAGLISTIGLFVYYFAIRIGGVIVTTPVVETWVIWGTLVAWPFLREPLRGFLLAGWGLIAAGLAALILGQLRGQPVSPQWYWAMPLAGLTAVSYGISGVLWRNGQLLGTHQSAAILVHFATSEVVALAGLIAMGGGEAVRSVSGRDVVALLGSGVLSGVVAIYCLFTALRLMEVARVYAFSSLTPLVATLFARFLLHEHLNLLVLSGVLLVSAGVALTQKRPPRRSPAAGDGESL